MKSTFDIFKNCEKFCGKWDNYFDIYDRHLQRFVGQNPNVLEIGICGGGSLEMWSKFFENGKIYGVDIDPQCLSYKYQQNNIHISQGDQGDSNFWKNYIKDKGKFDVIIDDGSHQNDHQLVTLFELFSHLNEGGLYIVEDTHTSYWEGWGGGFKKPNTFIEFTKNLIDFLHRQHIDAKPSYEFMKFFQSIKSITTYNSVVIFEKEFVGDITPVENKNV